MERFDGRVAAITGSGSGIGRALAIELARRGAHLALSDIDPDRLAETKSMVERDSLGGGNRQGLTVTSRPVDVADRQAVFEWANAVAAEHGRVNMILNNAGVALVSPVEATTIEDFQWLMNINFWGVVHGTQAFLPHLKAAGEGHVVNISSVFGLQAIPSQSAYNSAKFAVRGFTDALRIELEIDPCGVSATTIHPGGIKTNIVRDSRMAEDLAATRDEAISDFDRVARTSPEKAASQILAAVEKDRRRALIGPDAVVFDALSRLPAAVPQGLLRIMSRRERKRLGVD